MLSYVYHSSFTRVLVIAIISSVLESNVSIFERHFNIRRPLKEKTIALEMEVAMNGPVLVQSDSLLLTALHTYWKGGKWHFVKRSDVRDFFGTNSKVLQKLKKERSKLPFVCN